MMLNLKDFYAQKIWITPLNERHHAILEIDDVIVVNFDTIYGRECGIRGLDQILYLLHKIGAGRRFIFLSEDGANIGLSGGLTLVNNIISTFNLNKDTCMIIAREDIQVDNATVIVRESIIDWCRALHSILFNIELPQGPFQKKFAVWYHRGTIFRLHVARHLYDNYKDDSFISYQEPGIWMDIKLREFVKEESLWADQHAPIVYDRLFPDRQFDLAMVVGATRKPYADYFIEIVAETDILTTNWITEKTIKNLYVGKPFIVFGAPGTLAKLKDFGFKTFDSWIDESYDQITNIHDRLEAVKHEIDKIAGKSQDEITAIHKEMLPVLRANRKRYIEIVEQYKGKMI